MKNNINKQVIPTHRSSLADLPFQGRRQGIFRFPVIPRVAYQQRVKGSPTINALCCPLGAKTEDPWTLVAFGSKRGVTFISYLSSLARHLVAPCAGESSLPTFRKERRVKGPRQALQSALAPAQAMATALLLTLFFTSPAFAYTSCVGGTPITANVNGASGAPSTCTTTKCPSPAKTFCKSDKTMNWWSAFNWCKANGGVLADFTHMCPSIATQPNNVEGDCPALQGILETSQWVWSSYGWSTSAALRVNLLSGAVSSGSRNGSNVGYYALCE